MNIQGLYAAAVTPRRLGTQDINLGAMWELVDFLVSHGVDGIVLLGTTGEFVHFSNSERMRLVGLAPKRSRVPVLVNVSHSNFDGCVELAQAAQASRAAGVLLMPPHFFRYSSEMLKGFYRRFVEDAALSIPVLFYDIPLFTNSLSFSVTEELLREGVVQGVKDSTGDPENYQRLHRLRQEIPFTYMLGSDGLLAETRGAGVNGGISGVACAVPELMVALNAAIVKGDYEKVGRLDLHLNEFIARIQELPVPVGIKEAASCRGLKLGPHSLPFTGAQESNLGAFREWFKAWLPGVQKSCKDD